MQEVRKEVQSSVRLEQPQEREVVLLEDFYLCVEVPTTGSAGLLAANLQTLRISFCRCLIWIDIYVSPSQIVDDKCGCSFTFWKFNMILLDIDAAFIKNCDMQ
jgi:hypothetical protein